MDSSFIHVQVADDALERRRQQNRIAQRKFRLKKGQRKALNGPLSQPQDKSKDKPTASNDTATTALSFLQQQQQQELTDPELGPAPDTSVAHTELESSSSLSTAARTAQQSLTDNVSWDPQGDLGDWGQGLLDFSDGYGFENSHRQTPSPTTAMLSELSASIPAHLLQDSSTQGVTPDSSNNSSNSTNGLQHSQDSLPKENGPREIQNNNTTNGTPPPQGLTLYEGRIDGRKILSSVPQPESDQGWLNPLHIAAQKGHESVVRLLLRPNAPGHLGCDDRDSDGRTALVHAVITNHDTVARMLLEAGARAEAADRDGRSAIHYAMLFRRGDLLPDLFRGLKPADLDAYDVSGWTPIHMAAYRDFEAGISMLLENGASLDHKARKCPYLWEAEPS